jgi:mRNA degradation ribonuclease J1/J2
LEAVIVDMFSKNDLFLFGSSFWIIFKILTYPYLIGIIRMKLFTLFKVDKRKNRQISFYMNMSTISFYQLRIESKFTFMNWIIVTIIIVGEMIKQNKLDSFSCFQISVSHSIPNECVLWKYLTRLEVYSVFASSFWV